MNSITSKQWFQIISGVIGGLITGAALMQTLFGQDLTIKIVAGLGIANIMLSSVGTVLSGQANLIRDVAAMQGDDGKPAVRINVNANATPTLAAVALDPTQPNVGAASPQIRELLKDAAKG